MSVIVNLRHVEADNVQLKGELPCAELDIDTRDEAVRLESPWDYDLEVQKVEDGLLIQGELHLPLKCRCVRCLEEFEYDLRLSNWTRLLPLTGEDAALVINDCVDLTPYIREDMLLEFPQHPLCETECGGLPETHGGKPTTTTESDTVGSPAWNELNKLKFKQV